MSELLSNAHLTHRKVYYHLFPIFHLFHRTPKCPHQLREGQVALQDLS